MLKKIMVALDGSEKSERALWWATQYGKREKALILLFRAVDTSGVDSASGQSMMTEARTYLQRMETEINQAGLPAKIVVRKSKPALGIVRAAIEEDCDLIIMTTRGGSEIKRWAIGGVTEQVLRMSPIPVLPLQTRTRVARNEQVRRVILPVDGSRLAEGATWWAIQMAKLLKARLVFLHVFPGGPSGVNRRSEETFDALRQRLIRLCRQLKQEGIRARFAVRTGDAADRILGFARRNDMIVTTTHGEGGFKRWIFGSVAEKLIHEARIPVLVHKTFAQIKDKVLTA